MKEIWKDIPGYEGLYQASTLGRIKSLKRKTKWGTYTYGEKILKSSKDEKGYRHVILYKNGSKKMGRVNRLVAMAFIPNLNLKEQVNHKDGRKDNNKLSNLEWCTNSENQIHAYKNGLNKAKSGVDHYKSKLSKDQVLEIRKLYNTGLITQRALARRFNISRGAIIGVITNKSYKNIGV